MTDTCVFCGKTGTDFKPEHWISQWISRATVGKNQGVMHHVPGRDPWLARAVDLTVEHVCPDCNHHWMSDIESRSRNLVLPLIEGRTMSLVRKQQAQVATWCFLKLITLELGRPDDQDATYPPEVYRGFKIHQHPPSGCLLMIGHRLIEESPVMFVWWRSQAGQQTAPGLGPIPSYRTVLTIGHLVIDLIGVIANANLQTESDDRLVRVWPVETKTVDWPPATTFKGIVDNDLV